MTAKLWGGGCRDFPHFQPADPLKMPFSFLSKAVEIEEKDSENSARN
jgi:hypothetical protein